MSAKLHASSFLILVAMGGSAAIFIPGAKRNDASTYGECLQSYGQPVHWSVSNSVLSAKWNVWERQIAGEFAVKADAALKESPAVSLQTTLLPGRAKADLLRYLRLPINLIREELGTPSTAAKDEHGYFERFNAAGLTLHYDEFQTVRQVNFECPSSGRAFPLGAAGINLGDSRQACDQILGLPIATKDDEYEWLVEDTRLLLTFTKDPVSRAESVVAISVKLPQGRPVTSILPAPDL